MTEEIVTILIYVHAFFGGLGLISGLFSILTRKGGAYHKKTGKIFTYSMLINSLLSCIVSTIPKHENMFLFLIGIFTVYMVLAGNLALTFKNKAKATLLDSILSYVMLVTASAMILIASFSYGANSNSGNKILFLVFGSIGMLMAMTDLRMHKQFREKKTSWLKNHLSKMTGAMIASVTAFLVVALDGTSLVVWLSPTVLGTIYIIYWSRKVANQFPKQE